MTARSLPLALALLFAVPTAAFAQCQDWHVGPMANGNGAVGTDGPIYALTTWDPDGAGPQLPSLVAGGVFSQITGVPTANVAYADAATGQWHSFASAPPLTAVLAFTQLNGSLIAGGLATGFFNTGIFQWTGSGWSAMGGDMCRADIYNVTADDARCFAFFGTTLVTGGQFTVWGEDVSNCEGQYEHGVAVWDGVHWKEDQVGAVAHVYAMQPYNSQLVVSSISIGNFDRGVASWDGTNWHSMGAGLDNSVRAFTIYNGSLIAGGSFTHEGTNVQTLNHIGRWDGTNWHPLGLGANDTVACLAVYNGELIAGGSFTSAGGVVVGHIARWNGSIWQPLGGGTDGYVRCLTVYSGELIAGGDFLNADGRAVNHIARWNGYAWSAYGGETVSGVLAETNYLGRLVAGGSFQQLTNGSQPANNIASWDGVGLMPFDSGIDGNVTALKAFKYPGSHGANELVAGGAFSHAGGVAASNIARWDQTFTLLPPPAWAPMGLGLDGQVNAIERYNNVTIAGGFFTHSGTAPMPCIAQWNEAGGNWMSLAGSMNGPVYALKVYGPYLYAGGAFTTAGGVSTGGLARWDGANWSPVGGYLLGTVYALEIHNGQLVIGGDFFGLGTSPDIAAWDGVGFTSFGSSGTDNFVRSLASTGTRLYIGGMFSSVGGVSASNVAYWDGTWHDATGGAQGPVDALAFFNGEVEAGGVFASVRSATMASPDFARYSQSGIPWFAYQPNSPVVNPGDDAVIVAEPAVGYGTLTYRWYKNGAPMTDGSVIGGATIGGAASATLTIHGVTHYDAATYFLVVGNVCGNDTSAAATLTVNWTTDVPATEAGGETRLESLAPNPSRAGTRMDFALARAANVRVQVHDIAGRLVRELSLGDLVAGEHFAEWDGRGDDGSRVQAGVYFVGLQTDGRAIGSRRVAMVR